ncbi:MAG: hypothetical protein ACREOZ_03390, partial [Gloeomargaritales cyanobacterium]
MTRRIPSHRLLPADFRTLIRFALRCQLFDGSTPCRCFCDRADFDITGNHCFSCSSIHKTVAHNIIRDAISVILKAIVPYIEDVGDSAAELCREKTGLTPSASRLRPADVSVHYGDTKTNSFSALLIDVTTIGFAPSPHNTDVLQPTAFYVNQHHIAKETDKFRGGRGTEGISGEQVMATINNQNFQFVPFTVDPGGTIGPCGVHLLFGPTKRYPKELASTRLNHTNIHAAGHEALCRTLGKDHLSGLLRKADRGWIAHHGPSKWFRPYYQTTMPSTWAKQYLGLAFTRARLQVLGQVKKRLRSFGRNHDIANLSPTDLNVTSPDP